MPYILRYSYKVWSWLLATASRATVILVFITGFYAILTWRMAKAISSQTRAMIQLVALLQFHWKEEEYHPGRGGAHNSCSRDNGKVCHSRTMAEAGSVGAAPFAV